MTREKKNLNANLFFSSVLAFLRILLLRIRTNKYTRKTREKKEGKKNQSKNRFDTVTFD
jgi:hypothetical protein